MGEKLSEKNIKFGGIKSYQRKLDDETVIINYANVNWGDVTQLVVTKDDIHGLEVDKKRFIKKVNRKYEGILFSSWDR